MKIKLRNNLFDMWRSRVNCGLELNSPHWEKVLQQVQGTIVEVETDNLFRDQYDTVPIPGVSSLGIRAMAWMVEEVIDDARPGMARCGFCGTTTKDNAPCTVCKKETFLEPFTSRTVNV